MRTIQIREFEKQRTTNVRTTCTCQPSQRNVSMEEEGSTGSVASSKSLLNWLNTFDVFDEEKCTNLEQLASGHLLLKCLKSVIRRAGDDSDPSTSHGEPWDEVWKVLEEFCGCSLDKSISVQKVLSGNQEHIARVVVLYLCTVSHSKNNEQIVEKIKSLTDSDQREIMFFIQNTIASIDANAVADGSMTSGVGELLPDLEGQVSPSSLSQPSTPTETPASHSTADPPSKLSYRTPQILSKINPSGFFFDSPVSLKYFTSPAVSKNNPLAKVQAASPFTAGSRPTPLKLTAEVSRMQRRIHMLEGMVETHRKTASDYYTDLCAKSEQCETLLVEKNQLQTKVGQVEDFRDLQDELDQAKLNLSRAEKSVQRLRAEKESLCCYKDQVAKLEVKLKDYNLAVSKLQEYKEKMDLLSSTLSEKTHALDLLGITHRTIQDQLERMTSEHNNLSLQNDKYSREVRELLQKCRALEEDKTDLQLSLENKTESEQSVMSQNRELHTSLEQAKGELESVQDQRESLEHQLKAVESDFASYKTVVNRTLQGVQKENESLKVKCNNKDRELENEVGEKQSLSSKVTQLEKEQHQLQEKLAQLVTDTDSKISTLSHEKEGLFSTLATKENLLVQQALEKESAEKELVSLTKDIEEKSSQLTLKDKALSTLTLDKANLEKELARLRSDLAHSIERFEAKESTLGACKAELAEKDELIMALSSEKIELLGQRDTLQANIEGMNTKYNCVVQDMDDLQQESASITRELDRLISKDVAAQKRYSQLQASNEALAGQLGRVQQELKEEKGSGTVKDSTVVSLSADKADLEQQISRLQADYVRLLEVKEATEVEFKNQSSANDEKTAALVDENVSLTQQLRELQTQKKSMETKVLVQEDTLAEKEKELSLLASSVKTGLEEQIALQNQLSTKQAEIEQLKNQSASMDEKVTALQAENTSLSEKLGQLQALKENTETKLASKEKELNTLASSVKPDLEEQITKLRNELHAKQTEMEQHYNQCATKDKIARALEVENTSLLKQLRELKAQKEDMESKLSNLEAIVAEKEKELNLLASSMKADLEEQISELQNELQAKQADIEQCDDSLNSYKSQLSSMEGLVSSLESEKRALEERNVKLVSEYQAKSEAEDTKIGKCHELVAEFKTTVDQMKERLEECDQENARLKEALIQSEEAASAIQEKSEAAVKRFEEEKASMSEEKTQLEERLRKALEQQKESMDQCQQISSSLELNQQKYSSELQLLCEQNKSLQTYLDEKYSQLRDENMESLRKQTKLYEEMDHLRARELEATALCKEFKMVAEREQAHALSTTEDMKKLQSKLESCEKENVEETGRLEQELNQIKYQLLKEQREAASEKKSLMAQLSYASEKLRLSEKSSQVFSPPRSRPSSKSSRQKPAPIPKVDISASTISHFSPNVHDTYSDVELESQIQRKFDRLPSEGTQSVIPVDSSSSEEDDVLTLSSASTLDTSKKRVTIASQIHGGRFGANSRLSTITEDKQEVSEGRISELQRRNSRYLPHLKSSYPVELQTQRESPSICDERIKNGSRRSRKNNKPFHTVASSHQPTKKPVAFEIELQPDPLLSSTMVTKERKRSRERDDVTLNDDTMRSPAPKSLRRGSAPPTPQTRNKILTRKVRRTTMMGGGMKLREYLDEPDGQGGDHVSSAGQSSSGTVFVVSPPNSKSVGKGKLPKRLQENLSRRQAAQKPQSKSSNKEVKRETTVKKKSKVTTAAARRDALKTKN